MQAKLTLIKKLRVFKRKIMRRIKKIKEDDYRRLMNIEIKEIIEEKY